MGQSTMSQADIVKRLTDIVEEQQLYDPHNQLFVIGNRDLLNLLGKIRL